METEIVVGCGASALAHLYYSIKSSFDKGDRKYIVIGQDDLWKKIASVDREHEFGQPKQVVHFQGNQVTSDKPGFQKAGDIADQLDLMRSFLKDRNVIFVSDIVRSIRRNGGMINVETINARRYEANRVIVATGFGRSAPPSECPEEIKNVLKTNSLWLQELPGGGQNRIMGGTEYLYATDVQTPPPDKPLRVAVLGASATSAWVAARALALATKNNQPAKIYWITRSNFDEANPAGRNNEILEQAIKGKWLVKASIRSISVPNNGIDGIKLTLSAAPTTPPKAKLPTNPINLGQAYKAFYPAGTGHPRDAGSAPQIENITEVRDQIDLFVDHCIYALGGDPGLPGGAGQIIDVGIQNELQPVIDEHRRFDDDPNATTLAYKTPDGKVWIVGAAVFRGGGIARLRQEGANTKFSNVAASMCKAGSPPEGIAAIIAAAKAVNNYDENDSVRKLNLHTADFKEVENWFRKIYILRRNKSAPDRTARIMADQIIALRKHSVFGLSEIEIIKLGDPRHPFWNEVFAEVDGGKCFIDSLVPPASL